MSLIKGQVILWQSGKKNFDERWQKLKQKLSIDVEEETIWKQSSENHLNYRNHQLVRSKT